MTTVNRISELSNEVKNAKTFTEDGRQVVVKSCKELYNLIEEDYYTVGADALIDDMYRDLRNGNFAEPFMCEQKKGKFELYARIYTENVVPMLDN